MRARLGSHSLFLILSCLLATTTKGLPESLNHWAMTVISVEKLWPGSTNRIPRVSRLASANHCSISLPHRARSCLETLAQHIHGRSYKKITFRSMRK